MIEENKGKSVLRYVQFQLICAALYTIDRSSYSDYKSLSRGRMEERNSEIVLFHFVLLPLLFRCVWCSLLQHYNYSQK